MKRNKIYTRREPNKDGKLYFIFCEGVKTETTYFYFFNRISSQIIIQIVPITDGKNSPTGLFENAYKNLIKSKENPLPNYDLNQDDEVWFIIDTDKWGEKINLLREKVNNHQNWFVAQSNPSFEVWQYYHFEKRKPLEIIKEWKAFLDKTIKGGFNPKKHPVFIESAINNSETNYSSTNNQPDYATTEIFLLAKKILPLVKDDIDLLLIQNAGK